MKDIELKAILTALNKLEDYVYLREDNIGRYIEYAFKEGYPENNRCLSWYNSIQLNALKRNGQTLDRWKAIHKSTLEINKLYRLSQFTCGHEHDIGDKQCKPGKIRESCKMFYPEWTKEEPIKCACWYLIPVSIEELKEEYATYYKCALELFKYINLTNKND